MIDINGEALRKQVEAYAREHGKAVGDMAEEMGYNRNFLPVSINRRRLNESAAKMLNLLYGIAPESYIQKEEEDKEPANAWSVTHDVEPDKGRVLVRVNKDGETLASAYARIKQPQTVLTIMQAISYASHLCYKFAEQAELGK